VQLSAPLAREGSEVADEEDLNKEEFLYRQNLSEENVGHIRNRDEDEVGGERRNRRCFPFARNVETEQYTSDVGGSSSGSSSCSSSSSGEESSENA